MIVSLPDPGRPRDDDEHRARRAVDDEVGPTRILGDVDGFARGPRTPPASVRRSSGVGRPLAGGPPATSSSSPRQRRLGPDQRAGRRRGQLEAPGVEEEAVRTVPTSGPRRDVPVPYTGSPGDRVADRVEVDPDLVRPAGHEVELEERPAGEPLADPIAGRRRPAVGDDGHPGPVLRVAPDRRLDPADGGRRPPRGRARGTSS